jgi:hypothetical protein
MKKGSKENSLSGLRTTLKAAHLKLQYSGDIPDIMTYLGIGVLVPLHIAMQLGSKVSIIYKEG